MTRWIIPYTDSTGHWDPPPPPHTHTPTISHTDKTTLYTNTHCLSHTDSTHYQNYTHTHTHTPSLSHWWCTQEKLLSTHNQTNTHRKNYTTHSNLNTWSHRQPETHWYALQHYNYIQTLISRARKSIAQALTSSPRQLAQTHTHTQTHISTLSVTSPCSQLRSHCTMHLPHTTEHTHTQKANVLLTVVGFSKAANLSSCVAAAFSKASCFLIRFSTASNVSWKTYEPAETCRFKANTLLLAIHCFSGSTGQNGTNMSPMVMFSTLFYCFWYSKQFHHAHFHAMRNNRLYLLMLHGLPGHSNIVPLHQAVYQHTSNIMLLYQTVYQHYCVAIPSCLPAYSNW